ncbi:MAG: AAA family ATPase [Bacteroidales bacterium]|nr:AAA family ATPase [Bacteroidales bacterium]
MKNTKQNNTILQLMEILSEKSEDTHLNEAFWAENGSVADELAARLSITPTQAVLFSVSLRKGPRNVDFDDIARHLDISNIRALTYSDDINALIRAKYLKYRAAKDEDSFDVPVSVIRALKNDEAPEPRRRTGLSGLELFDYMDELYEDLDNDALEAGDLYHELKDLFASNKDLAFVRELNALGVNAFSDWMVLVILCHLLVNKDDDSICYSQIEDVYRHKSDFFKEKGSFRAGTHPLMEKGLVEHECNDGQANTNRIHLTDKAKTALLAEFDYRRAEAPVGGLVKPETLAPKTLFYTAGNAGQVEELLRFLSPDRYNEIRSRMKDTGFRSGFACLFYGAPGTGKTETVYQIARQTGRSLMTVNVPDIKSKWVGESEKNIKEVFDRYRQAVERSERAPILLFNEADAIIGIRREGATSAVDKMENSIQNIILQEMENLDGIMIATTNLTQNLDPAFERRFLYKIRFDRPDAAVREKIWHTMLPALSEEQCAALASAYDLSGGQMENVARKFSINTILYGSEKPAMDVLHAYCNAERLGSQTQRRIGF